MDIGVYTIYPWLYCFGRPKSITANGIKLPPGDGQGVVSFEYDGKKCHGALFQNS